MQIGLLAVLIILATSTPAGAGLLSPGDYRFELESAGRTRSYLMHVPPRGGPLPLVISLHGGGGNAEQHRRSTGMDAAADRDGYVVVYPNGSGRGGDRLLTWNAGNCCAYAQKENIDDVGFIARVIDDAQRQAAIDASRIYVAGHSNGGMMAHRVGEALPDRVAAIASVAGVHVPASGRASRAVPVLHIHSVDDPQALYRGGYGPPPLPFAPRILHSPVDAMLEAWIARDGCGAVPKESAFREAGADTARRLDYGGCRDGATVALWKLTGAGHAWPGGAPARERSVGAATQVIDANSEIWKFFSRFALPSR